MLPILIMSEKGIVEGKKKRDEKEATGNRKAQKGKDKDH